MWIVLCFVLFFLYFFFRTSVIQQHGEHSGEDPVTHERVIPPGKAEKTGWALCERRIIM